MSGCVVWNFVDTRYQNVTGYFNSMYNARTLFAEATAEIQEQEKSFEHPKDSGESPTTKEKKASAKNKRVIKKEYGVPSAAAQKLDKVIEKCSRILVAYSKSKWVDDALLLIGKSYYYKHENVRAERKFNELIDRYKDSPLIPEAVLWLGKTHAQAEHYERAQESLDRAVELGIAAQDPEVVAEAYYSMGEMNIDRDMEEDAVKAYQKGAEYAASSNQRLRIQLALAKEQEKLGNKKEAAEAYRNIINLNPSTEQMFTAELCYARLCRETGQFDDCANTLLDMLDNPSYLQYDSKIQLEIGNYFGALAEYPSAIDQYTYVDTTWRNTPEAGEASYSMGSIYEYKLLNYDKAFEKYSNARQGSSSATATGKGTTSKTEIFGEYRRFRNKMYDVDTLFFYVLHPDSLARRDSLQALTDSLERERTGQGPALTEEQLAIEKFQRRRPHGRNTGKINPYLAKISPTGGPEGKGAAGTAGLVPLYRKFNLQSLSKDSLLIVISQMRMEMGWIMFGKIGNLDSAAWYYKMAVDGKLSDSSRAQAYFTLSEIARAQNNAELAAQYEDVILRDFPRTGYAFSIMRSRGQTPPDTIAFLTDMYNKAAVLLEQGRYSDGIKSLEHLVESYPRSSTAMRARLAIAMTYEGPLNNGEKAIALYRAMIADNPSSPYSKRGKDIIALIDKPPTKPGDTTSTRPKLGQKPPETKKPDVKKTPSARGRPGRFKDEDFPGGVKDSTGGKPYDPSNDVDFPLTVPGEKPVKQEGKQAPGEKKAAEGESKKTGVERPKVIPPGNAQPITPSSPDTTSKKKQEPPQPSPTPSPEPGKGG
jgi:tetratricopeptide (TPR) repeat protein